MSAMDEAKQSIIDMHAAVEDLAKDYAERIEQLEAEVESWKNSYERANAERAELALRLQTGMDDLEEEIARQTETPDSP